MAYSGISSGVHLSPKRGSWLASPACGPWPERIPLSVLQVCTSRSSAQRSQTSGHLVVTMPLAHSHTGPRPAPVPLRAPLAARDKNSRGPGQGPSGAAVSTRILPREGEDGEQGQQQGQQQGPGRVSNWVVVLKHGVLDIPSRTTSCPAHDALGGFAHSNLAQAGPPAHPLHRFLLQAAAPAALPAVPSVKETARDVRPYLDTDVPPLE